MSRAARKEPTDAAPEPDATRTDQPVSLAHAARPQATPKDAATSPAVDSPDALASPETPPRQRGGRFLRIVRGILKTLLPLAVIALGFAGYKYLKATRPEAPKQAQLERAFAIETVTAVRTTAQPTLTLYGNIVAGRQVDIRALVAGRVVTTNDELREGGRIKAGAALLAVDPFEYVATRDEAKAQRAETAARLAEQQASLLSDRTSLEHARAQLAIAEADVERAQQLVARGNLPERSLDDRRQIVLQRRQATDQLANSIRIWEARIAQTKTAGERLDVIIARAERRLVETELNAPFDAYVTEVGAQIGRMMSVNDKVATLIDQNWIEAQFSLSDSQFGRIVARDGKLEGRDVEVRWTLGGQTFSYKARIERVAARISSASGGIDVFARVLDPSTPVPLRPGAFVELALDDIRFDDVIRVPNTSLYDGDTVYAIIDGRLDPRKVRVVGTTGSDLLVLGPLKDGEEIAKTRMSTPGKGVLVRKVAPTATVAPIVRESKAP